MTEFLEDGLELFATVQVADSARAWEWYRRLLGADWSFRAHDDEVVWELAPHRWLVVVRNEASAGHSVVTVFVDDLDARVADAAGRGVEPDRWERYEGDVRKALFVDPDGNEIGLGG
ncbi:VOC family protein [Nocardioides sp. BGMRC 2183]|nr:VOC family protein [Nocardioides sp. BGMRC 2183]